MKITRIRNDLKLEEVAENLGFNRETLRRYENNATGLSVERLEELLNYYNVNKKIFLKTYMNICTIIKKKRSNQ